MISHHVVPWDLAQAVRFDGRCSYLLDLFWVGSRTHGLTIPGWALTRCASKGDFELLTLLALCAGILGMCHCLRVSLL